MSDYINRRNAIWQPWSDFRSEPVRLPIKGPPCASCKHWFPVQLVGSHNQKAASNGIRCCHAKTMRSDFSCFDIEKEKGER